MMAEISEESPKDLIQSLKFDVNIRSDVNGFDSRQHLFDFGIESDLSLNERKRIPNLKEEFHKSKNGLDIELGEGMAQAMDDKKMITNYDNNRKQVWTHFLQCLQKHKTVEEEEPTFVTLSPIITDFFAIEEWDSTFYALKHKGVIYLFRNKSLELDEEVEGRVTPHAYFHIKFSYLISDKNDSDINGFERCMRVDRIDFNGNKLIVCFGVAANDRNGTPIYVKCRQIFKSLKDSEYRYRLLNNWSNCVVDGVQTLVIGRRYRSKLEEVRVIDVNTIPVKCRSYWSDSKCFSFVDQTLEFIKSCVGSEHELYEFEINSKDKTLSCFRQDSTDTTNYFLPKFYTI